MAYKVGTVTGSALNNATSGHKMLFNAIRTFVETELPLAERWTAERAVVDSAGAVISSITRSGTTATVTTATPHLMASGDTATIAGSVDTIYNGSFLITVTGDFTFTYVMLSTPAASPATGSVSFTRNSWEVIWKAPGLSGTEEIFMGIKTYQSGSADYYNFKVAGFTGYVPANPFETQAGASAIMGATFWNQAIDYWFVGNGEGLLVFVKVLDVIESFGFGKYYDYATPSQYPYPVFVFASMPTAALTRYDSTSLVSGWKGSRANFVIRAVSGLWTQTDNSPYNNSHQLRNTITLSSTAEGYYAPHAIVLSTSVPDVYGELKGLYYMSGFNNATENTISVGGVTYVILRDRRAVGFNDYIALRLQ